MTVSPTSVVDGGGKDAPPLFPEALVDRSGCGDVSTAAEGLGSANAASDAVASGDDDESGSAANGSGGTSEGIVRSGDLPKKTRAAQSPPHGAQERTGPSVMPEPMTEGGRARREKERDITNCLAGDQAAAGATSRGDAAVDLWRLRSLALSPGGLLAPALRRRAWPTLLSVHALLLETASVTMNDLLRGDIEGVDVVSPLERDLAELRGDVMRHGGSAWHVERHIRRHRERGEADARPERGSTTRRRRNGETGDGGGRTNAAPQAATPSRRRPPAAAPRKRVQIVPPPPSPCGASYAGGGTSVDGSSSPPTPLVQYHSNGTNGASPSRGQKKVLSALLRPSISRGNNSRMRTRSTEERQVLLSVVMSALRSPPTTSSTGPPISPKTTTKDRAGSAAAEEDRSDSNRLRYYSGLHDLAALLLIHLESPSLTSLALRRLSEHHLRDAMRGAGDDVDSASVSPSAAEQAGGGDGGGSELSPLDAAVRIALPPLLKELDAELHDFFFDPPRPKNSNEERGGDSGHGGGGKRNKGAKWLRALAARGSSTWFVRDVPDADVTGRLVDALVVSHPLMPLYLTVALLTHPPNRKRILACACPNDGGGLKALLEGLPRETMLPKNDGDDGHVSGRDESHDSYLDLLEWRQAREEQGREVDDQPAESSSNSQASRQESDDDAANPRRHCLRTREDELSRLLEPADSLISRAVAFVSSVPPSTLLRRAQIYHHDHRRRRNQVRGDDKRSLLPYLHAMDEDTKKSKSSYERHALAALRCRTSESWTVSPGAMTDWEALVRMGALRDGSSPDPCAQAVAKAAVAHRRPLPSHRLAMDAAGFPHESSGTSTVGRRKKIIVCASVLAAGGAAASATVAYKMSGEGRLALSMRSAGQDALHLLVNTAVAKPGSSLGDVPPTLRGEEAEDVAKMTQSSNDDSVDVVTLIPSSDAEEATPSRDAKEEVDADKSSTTAQEDQSDCGSSPHTLPSDLSSSSSVDQQQLPDRAAAGEISRDALVGGGSEEKGEEQEDLVMELDAETSTDAVALRSVAVGVMPGDQDAEAPARVIGTKNEALEIEDLLSLQSSPPDQLESVDGFLSAGETADFFGANHRKEDSFLDGVDVHSFESAASRDNGTCQGTSLFANDGLFTSGAFGPTSVIVRKSNECDIVTMDGAGALSSTPNQDSAEESTGEMNILEARRAEVEQCTRTSHVGEPEETVSSPTSSVCVEDNLLVGPGDRSKQRATSAQSHFVSSCSPISKKCKKVATPLAKFHRLAFAKRTSRYSLMPEEDVNFKASPQACSVDNMGGIHLISETVSQWRKQEESKERRNGLGHIRYVMKSALEGATFTAHYSH